MKERPDVMKAGAEALSPFPLSHVLLLMVTQQKQNFDPRCSLGRGKALNAECPSVNQGRFAEESLSSMQDLHVVCSQEAAFETPGKAVAYRL